MTKKLFLPLLLLVFGFYVKAQTNIANYTFNSSTSTYVPLTGATTYLSVWDGQVSGNIPLGGTFTFGGVNYTTCNIYANGYITFGAGSSYVTPLSGGTFNGVIAAFAQDGTNSVASGASPKILYKNIGGASGEFVVQYTDHANLYNKSTEKLNFQIHLNLATEEIKIVYGSFTNPGISLSGTFPQVGIRGNSTNWTTNVNSLTSLNTPNGTTCDWSDAVTSSANNSSMLFSSVNNLVRPTNGLTLTWAPPVNPLLAPVRAFASVSNITGISADLSWLAPSAAIQYNVQYKIPSSCVWTNFSGNPVSSNSVTLTGLNPTTIYQVRVQSSDGANNAIWSHIPDQAGTGNGYTANGTFSTTVFNCVTPPFAGIISGPTTVVNGTTASYTVSPTVGNIQWYGSFNPAGPWSPITSGTVASGQPIEAIGTGTVFYTAVASSLGCLDDTANTSLQVVITGTTYCTPAPTSVDGNGIINVNIKNGAINNPSGAEVGNYGNYTSLIANVNQGVNVPVAITFSTDVYDYNTKIWIDFNNDFDFEDAGEEVFSGVSLATSPNTLTAVVYIPLSTSLGNHRMRIGAIDAGDPIPCYVNDFGTYEDYTLNIITAPPCTLTPNAGIISGPANATFNSTNTYSISPAAGQLQWYIGLSATGPWTAIASATNISQPIQATINNNVYYTVVAYSPGCINDTATAILTVVSQTAYCIPSPTSVDGSGIINVNISNGAVNNPSGAETNNYGNYSSLTANTSQGASLPVAVSFSTAGFSYNTKIWIDYNNDNDFEDVGEEVFSGASSTVAVNTVSASISIPSTALAGTHKMRIGGVWSNTPTPCYSSSFGTYEDYSINIAAVTCTPTPLSVDGSGIINVNIQNGAINNPSGAEPGNYGDYSSLVANVNQGTYVPVAITFSTSIYDYNTKIWIDYNNDNDFDDVGEEVYAGLSATVSPNTLNASFYVPLTATLGNHRLRIGAADIQIPTPCFQDDFGTFEDYTINVLAAPACTTTPTAGAVSGPTVVAINSINSYSLSPAAGQIQWYSSSSLSGPWTAIATGTSNPISITANTQGTIYYTAIAYAPGCINDTATTLLTVVNNTSYCVPSPQLVDGSGIINVNINNGVVNNTTGAEVNNYGNYSSMIAGVNKGTTIPVAITFSTGIYDYNTKIWVDFNNDFDFDDAGEEVFSGVSGTVSPNTLTASISIPITATTGNHLLRIGAVDSGTPTPCYSDYYGTYEDYTLNVLTTTCTPSPTSVDGNGIINVNINNGSINNPSGTEPNNYGLYTSLTATVYQGVSMPAAITFSTDVFDYNTKIWIDFNNDSDFDDVGEEVYSGVSGLTSPNTLNALISIPTNAPLGNHTIRIGAIDVGIPTPCYNGSYGTYEDYTLNILAAPACTLTPVAGVISGSTTVSAGTTNSYSISPITGTVQWYSSTNVNGPWSPILTATTAVGQSILASGSGTVYYTAIASGLGCLNDTTTPIAVSIVFLGDKVCSAIPLSIGTSPKYNIYGASVEAGEVHPSATGFETNSGWGSGNITNTLWFSFVAPASGNVSVQAPTSINAGNNDSQLAIWSATNCANLIGQTTPTAPIGASLVAANDDDSSYVAHSGAIFSSYVRAACLTPGKTYYIQLDTYSAASFGDSSRIVITDLGSFNPSFNGLSSVYCLSSPSSSLVPVNGGGLFTINNATTSVTSFTPNALGNYTVTYSVFGCTSQQTTSVVNGPTVTITPSSSSICNGFTAILNASGATSYTWTPSNTNGVSVAVTPSVTTTYTLYGNSGGCTAIKTFSLLVNALPSVTISATSTTVCPNTTMTLSAISTATNSYSWSDGSNTPKIVLTPTVNTTYSVTVINSCGGATGTISIVISNSVNVSATTSNSMLCSGQTAILTANGATSYTWMPLGSVSQTISVAPSSPTTYTLLGQSSCGNAFTTITQNVSICTDISSSERVDTPTVYPNPNYGVLSVSIPKTMVDEVVTIEIIDALGKVVLSEKISTELSSLSINHLDNGVYFYRILNNTSLISTGKLIKQ